MHISERIINHACTGREKKNAHTPHENTHANAISLTRTFAHSHALTSIIK